MVRLDEGGRLRRLHLFAPPAALSQTVEHFWVQQAMPAKDWRVIPDVSGHVIFSITRGPSGLSAWCRIVGARRRFADIAVDGRVLTIGARLAPGALPLLLRAAPATLNDLAAPLECIAGSAGRGLVERMTEAPPCEALLLLADFLRRRLGQAAPALPPGLLRNTKSVDDLASRLGVSRRAAYDRLSTAVGLPPKLALRIERLHDALRALNARATLADAAAQASFCDQAHFSREAMRLLGESPAAWRRRGCSFLQDGA